MNRIFSSSLLALLLTSSLPSFAAEEPPAAITEIFKRDHPELAGKEVLVMRIVLQPGVSAPPHVHPGMVTGYVESGTLEFQLKGEAQKTLKAGDIFFEPPGSHHMLAKNPSDKDKTVVIAFVVNPKGAPLSVPMEEHKQ